MTMHDLDMLQTRNYSLVKMRTARFCSIDTRSLYRALSGVHVLRPLRIGTNIYLATGSDCHVYCAAGVYFQGYLG